MASETQETLYRIFAGLAGGSVTGAAGAGFSAGATTPAARTGESVTSDGIPAAISGLGLGGGLTGGAIASAVSAASGQSNGSGAAEIALSVVKSGLGVVPLIGALFGLFGGGDEEKPVPLIKYALPNRREFHVAATASGFAEVDYDETGLPRAYEPRASEASPAITVNVQAMDARSFLDRSSDIAAAVREAMLNLNSINDVVTDL